MTCPNCRSTFTIDSLTTVNGKAPGLEKVKPEVVDIKDVEDIRPTRR